MSSLVCVSGAMCGPAVFNNSDASRPKVNGIPTLLVGDTTVCPIDGAVITIVSGSNKLRYGGTPVATLESMCTPSKCGSRITSPGPQTKVTA